MRRRRFATALIGGLAAIGAGGCGQAATRPAAETGPCSTAARAVIGRAAGTPAALVAATKFTAPSGAASCRFAVREIGVQSNIDTAPQAYERLERETVEYGQTVIWSHQGPAPYPQNVTGLGVAADWFPRERRVLATDGTRLVAVTVTWQRATQAQARMLAEALARDYVAQ